MRALLGFTLALALGVGAAAARSAPVVQAPAGEVCGDPARVTVAGGSFGGLSVVQRGCAQDDTSWNWNIGLAAPASPPKPTEHR